MYFYNKYVLPKIIHFACSRKSPMRQRRDIVRNAKGVVLEVGIGTGLNLPYYDTGHVTKIIGLDPSLSMLRIAKTVVDSIPINVQFVDLPGENIILEDGIIDTVLMTYTLCSIKNTKAALQQMARVLKVGGKLIFCEHGASPDLCVRRCQNRLNPLWKCLGGGCHLNRKIPQLIEEGGFKILNLEANYIPGWRPASFNYWGEAEPM